MLVVMFAVFVVGAIIWFAGEHIASTEERGYRDAPATQLVLAGSEDPPLAITIADPL